MEEKGFSTVQLFMWMVVLIMLARWIFAPREAVVVDPSYDRTGYKFAIINSDLERAVVDKNLPKSLSTPSALSSKVVISTSKAIYKFNPEYAALVSVEYKDIKDDVGSLVNSFGSADKTILVGSPLLLLGSDVVPVFKLKDKSEDETSCVVTFESLCNGLKITKQFVIDNSSYKVDLHLDMVPEADGYSRFMQPRLVFASPYGQDVSMQSATGFVNNEKMTGLDFISTVDCDKSAWKMPYVFGSCNRFFTHAYVADKKLQSEVVRRAWFDCSKNNQQLLFLELSPVSGRYSNIFEFYFGPKKADTLVAVHKDLDNVLSYGILSFLCKPLLGLLEWLFNFCHNYGLAIIMMAFLLRLPFFPLMIWSRKKMFAHELFETRYAREIADINRKYANSFAAKSEQLAQFYASHNQSQMGKIVAVVPNFLQIPIVFALYRVLINSISLYNAEFLLWIKDLSAADPYYFLPLLLGVMSFVQQLLVTIPMPETTQTRLMRYAMPVIMFMIFAKLPAGLVLYWICNNLFAIIEDIVFKKFFRQNTNIL